MTKGLILAGGKGTRLLPVTKITNKHLVPILNRPMITYPLETLKVLGVKDIMIVSGGDHIGGIAEFLGDGSSFGVSLTYRVQTEAGGIAQALGLAKDFVGQDSVFVILGDNVFENTPFTDGEPFNQDYAYVFLKEVPDAYRFGVAGFKDDTLVNINEKPKHPQSNWAVTGLYYYPHDVFDIIPNLVPSDRGELEITAVNNFYLLCQRLKYIKVDSFWSDAGTVESLFNTTEWAYKQLK